MYDWWDRGGLTCTVSGNGSYSPSTGFTPTGSGTYWWYASYSGDSNDSASNSGCGTTMGSTTVGKATTATGAAAPATGTAGTVIASSAISSALSGATNGAGGTVTFTVFGPQATAPTICTTGGTAVGSPVTAAGDGSYNPSAGFTPNSAGTYWWYASYSGDNNNIASSSACGAGMASTTVGKATTATRAAAPTTGTAGTAIAASSVSSALSGAEQYSGRGDDVQGVRPTGDRSDDLHDGRDDVGTAVTVSGNGTCHPSTAFTPSAAGNYWWYASYAGDTNNNGSASACGTTMAKTVVYSATSVANTTNTSFLANSATTSSFTVSPTRPICCSCTGTRRRAMRSHRSAAAA